MGIIVNLDVVMAKRKIGSGELAEKIGITQANLSILKTGKAKAVRFSKRKFSAAHRIYEAVNRKQKSKYHCSQTHSALCEQRSSKKLYR